MQDLAESIVLWKGNATIMKLLRYERIVEVQKLCQGNANQIQTQM